MGLPEKHDRIPVKIITIIFLLFTSCAGQISNLYAEVNERKSREVKRIGIEEFQIQNRSDSSDARSIDPNSGTKVADIFYKKLLSYHHYDLIAPAEMPFKIELVKTPETSAELPAKVDQTEKSEAGMLEEKSEDMREIPESNLIDLDAIVTRIINRYNNTDLDAVVTGVITKYNNKDGSTIAVDRPASVAFMAYLISLKDKKILWSGHFSETQVALLDNLLLADQFNQARGKWLNSDDLTGLVMQKAIMTFPGLSRNKAKPASE